LRDLIVAEVHMTAAALAHGGAGRDGHFQFRAALEAVKVLLLDRRFLGFGGGALDFSEPEVGATFFADGGVSAGRLGLAVPAFGAGDRNLFLF